VRTVPRFGYAFCGEAREAPTRPLPRSPLSCRLVYGTREVELAPGENILGRTPEAAVWVDDASVSRQHARITVSGDEAVLEDLGSKNGTFVGRARVRRATPLSDGDQVFLGSAVVVFRARRPQSTRTLSRG
jgi:predicted component of type VI protein secretion system